jgi:hypothetical protein
MKVNQALPLILLLSAFSSVAFAQDDSVYASDLGGPHVRSMAHFCTGFRL